MALTTMNPSAVFTGSGLGSQKLMTLFLSMSDKTQKSHFWNFFLNFQKNVRRKFQGVLEHVTKIRKIEKKNFFLQKFFLFLAETEL